MSLYPIGACRESGRRYCLVQRMLRDRPLFWVFCVSPRLEETSALPQRAHRLPDQTEHKHSHDD